MPPSKPSSPVGLVTVSFNSSDAVEALLESIRGASTNPVDVVVVDNLPGGDRRLVEVCEAAGARLVPRPDNPGYGGGINAGVARLSDSVEWILVVNPDVELGPGSIDALVAVGTSDDRIGAIGPRVIDHSGSTYPSARSIPSLRVGIGHALLGDLVPQNPWTRDYHRASSYDSARDAGWLSGSCVLVRRTAFNSVGGFDDGYFMYFEDVDLGFRLGLAGWRSVYTPSATVAHEGGHSTRDNSTAMIAAHHTSARRWIATRYRGVAWWPIRAAVNLGLRLRESVATKRRLAKRAD